MNTDPLGSGHLYVCSECGCECFLLDNQDTGKVPFIYCPNCCRKSAIRVDNPKERSQIHQYRVAKTKYFSLLETRTQEEREGTSHA